MKTFNNLSIVAIIAIVSIVVLVLVSTVHTVGRAVNVRHSLSSPAGGELLVPLNCEINNQNFLLGGECRLVNENILRGLGCTPGMIIVFKYPYGCIKLEEDLVGRQISVQDGSEGFYFTCQGFKVQPPAASPKGIEVKEYGTVRDCVVESQTHSEIAKGFLLQDHARVENSISRNNGKGFEITSTTAINPATCEGCQAFENDVGFELFGYAKATAQGYPYDDGCRANDNTQIGFMLSDHSSIESCSAIRNGNKNDESSKGIWAKDNALIGRNVGAADSYYGFYLEGYARIEPSVHPAFVGAGENIVGYYVTGKAKIISTSDVTATNNAEKGFFFESKSPTDTPYGEGALVAYGYDGIRPEIGIHIKGNGARVNAYPGLNTFTNDLGIKVEGTGAQLYTIPSGGAGQSCFNDYDNMLATSGGEITGTWRTTDPITDEGGYVHDITYLPCEETPQCGNNRCEYYLGEKCDTCPGDCYACDHWCGNGQCDQWVGEGCECESDCICGGGGSGGGSPFAQKDSQYYGGSPLFMKYDPWGNPCDHSGWYGCYFQY